MNAGKDKELKATITEDEAKRSNITSVTTTVSNQNVEDVVAKGTIPHNATPVWKRTTAGTVTTTTMAETTKEIHFKAEEMVKETTEASQETQTELWTEADKARITG